MNTILLIFGEGEHINVWQMSARAFVIFILTIVLIRISGRRSFGMKSPFDNTITILLGAVLSRAVVGASPFFSTLAAALVLVAMHRMVSWSTRRSRPLERFLKGHELVLYKDGQIIEHNMSRALLSESELLAAVRTLGHETKLENIERAYLETSGRVSIILKDESKDKANTESKEGVEV